MRDAVRELTARFAGDLVHEGPLERIQAVAVALSEALNTSAWAISFAPAGGETLHTVIVADGRDKRLAGLHIGLDNEVYAIDEYPATARLLETGAGAFVTNVADQTADRAERALLELLGRTSVLAASAADHDLTWLLELYADDRTAPLEEGLVEAALLLRAAIPPRSARKGAALRERWAQQVGLTNSLGARIAEETLEQAMVDATVEELHLAMGVAATGAVQAARRRADRTGRRARRLRAPRGARHHAPRPGRPGAALRARAPRRARRRRDAGARLHEHPRDGGRALRARRAGDGRRPPVGRAVRSNRPSRTRSTRAMRACCAPRPTSSPPACARPRCARGSSAPSCGRPRRSRPRWTPGLPRPWARRSALVQRCEAVGRRLELSDADLSALRYAATLHDIGELGVPEAILNKPGPLTDEERPAIERHPLIGEGILSPVEFLAESLPLVRAAHERWDGAGYPDGLSGEEIPLGARILFACDCYDAMTTERPYRAALPAEEAKQELRRVAGHAARSARRGRAAQGAGRRLLD